MKEKVRVLRCLELINSFTGKQPLSLHLKKYFNFHPEMGSTDRRVLRELVYNYYRMGRLSTGESVETRMALGNFIFGEADNPMQHYILQEYLPFGKEDLSLSHFERFNLAKLHFSCLQEVGLFPWMNHLSEEIPGQEWLNSFFIRPLVWIRVKRNLVHAVLKEFDENHLKYVHSEFSPEAYGLEASSKISETRSYQKGLLEIQDLSSQLTAGYFEVKKPGESWWDCCSGSGGKGLLLLDHHPGIRLTASDVRPMMLNNLKKRFSRAGFKDVKTWMADLFNAVETKQQFDGIIMDAPCSGSGTWNRTPERIGFFKEEEITGYADKQRLFVKNVIPSLKNNGYLVYITCSVFREENEGIVSFAKEQLGLQCEKKGIIPGYQNRSDTLFAALLRKSKDS